MMSLRLLRVPSSAVVASSSKDNGVDEFPTVIPTAMVSTAASSFLRDDVRRGQGGNRTPRFWRRIRRALTATCSAFEIRIPDVVPVVSASSSEAASTVAPPLSPPPVAPLISIHAINHGVIASPRLSSLSLPNFSSSRCFVISSSVGCIR